MRRIVGGECWWSFQYCAASKTQRGGRRSIEPGTYFESTRTWSGAAAGMHLLNKMNWIEMNMVNRWCVCGEDQRVECGDLGCMQPGHCLVSPDLSAAKRNHTIGEP